MYAVRSSDEDQEWLTKISFQYTGRSRETCIFD